MSPKIKNYLGGAIILALLVLSFGAMKFVGAYTQMVEPGSFRSFSVMGEGKIVAVPDVAQFTFSVITQDGKNLADLQKDNTEKVNKAIAFVKSKGVDQKDVKTENYNVEPRYQYFNCSPSFPSDSAAKPCPPPEIVGYSITQTVLVKVRKFEAVGEILSGVVQNGANTVSQLSFTIDDPTEVQNKARVEAIEKAKVKARAIAKAGGFGLGRLLSIEEGGGYTPFPYYNKSVSFMEGRGGGNADVASAPTVEPGSQDVNISVTLRYEIE